VWHGRSLPEGGDGAGHVMRSRQRLPTLACVVCVGDQRLLDAIRDLGARRAKRDDTGEIGDVRAPPSVLGLLVDHDVFAHRRCSKSLA
jgi:hypothetical protein